ncbi:MAG: PKD domain-containing protein, partial [Bacteroidales bacterium]|nr:PKD domain-containing protein [Bacteroidales bacterium]
GFAYSVASDIPDLEEVSIAVTATSGSDLWESFILIEAHAPVLSVGTLTISDPNGNNNGLLDPGETATLIIPVSNNGSSLSPDATAYLNSTSNYITFNTTSYDLGPIDIGATVDASFNVSVSPSAPVGESVDLDFDVIAGDYNASKSFVTSIGLIIEDWETGNFNKFPWIMGGNADWTIETNNPYEGIYCARSGNIADSQVSNLELTINVTSDGEITFFRKVSSEYSWDYLRFFIDGNQIDEWSGNVAWGQESFPVNAGVHTFKWEYYKDGSVSSGEDCAWIDYIIFPATIFEASFSSNETNICEGESVNFYDQSSGNAISWDWIFEGGTPSTSTMQDPVIEYSTPGIYDVSLTVSNGSSTNTLVLENYITVTALPEVTLEPFDWVCLDWPAFELSGGLPAGGEYSGQGVENGWFNPTLAGIGTHTITYTYTDPEECENFATETILVDPCTGINNLTNLSGLVIYPNPTTGMIFVGLDQNIGPIEVIVVNTLNDVVYSYSSENLTRKKLNIDLSNLVKGIYFIKIKTDTIEKTTKVVLW